MASLLIGLGFLALCAAAAVSIIGEKTSRRQRNPPAYGGFAAGDRVKIREGPLECFEGTAETTDVALGKVNLVIEIYGRAFPIRLDYRQVESI